MKLLWVFRFIFVVILISVIFVNLQSDSMSFVDGTKQKSDQVWYDNLIAIIITGFVLCLFVLWMDLITPKKKLGSVAGVFFGLIIGIVLSWGGAKVVDMLRDIYNIPITNPAAIAIKWILGTCICYLVVSIVMRTKDDVRFIIPYVEFAKQTKGTRPLVLDTSVIIDGRIADLCRNSLFDAPLIVPRFVLNELQLIADSANKLKRNRGRRGLDVLHKMQSDTAIDVKIDDTIIPEVEEVKGVDQKLLLFSKAFNGRLATTDYNLSKVAQLRDVNVLNINDLANSLKVVVLPGETMEVKIIKPGEEADQGIGYLDDGTMIVVEGGRNKIGKELVISVTSSIQTSAGKMIFGKFEDYASHEGVAVLQRQNSNDKPKPVKTDSADSSVPNPTV
jgi:uncharacterized protein YacL